MSAKEELTNSGWEIVFSGPCNVKAWGTYMIHLSHVSGRKVSGYGATELEAFHEASDLIRKPIQVTTNETENKKE